MATQTYTDDVIIDGSENEVQLTVQGHSTQTNPLQVWEDSAGNTLAQVEEDGRLQVGDDIGMSSADALIEAHRDTGSILPKRGFHSLGKISSGLEDPISWIVQELVLTGNIAMDTLHRVLNISLTNQNTGNSASADLRAVDITAVNEGGNGGSPVGELTGLAVTVTNQTQSGESGGHLTTAKGIQVDLDKPSGSVANAYGLKIEDVDQGSSNNHAIHTSKGDVQFGDDVNVDGSLTSKTTTTDNNLIVSASAGQNRQLLFQSDGLSRLALLCTNQPEGGSNAGSDAALARFDDAGNFVGFVWEGFRSNGTFKVNNDLYHAGSNVGFYDVTPTPRATGYSTFANLTTDRTCDASSVTVAELADIVGTLIEDLKKTGIIGG